MPRIAWIAAVTLLLLSHAATWFVSYQHGYDDAARDGRLGRQAAEAIGPSLWPGESD